MCDNEPLTARLGSTDQLGPGSEARNATVLGLNDVDKQKLEEARQLAMSMTSHPVAFGTIEHTERAGELLAEMVKANEVLAREAHTWSTAARDAAKVERAGCALRVALHSQYPIETDYDRGYDKARKDAAETLRTMGDDAGLELGPNVRANRETPHDDA